MTDLKYSVIRVDAAAMSSQAEGCLRARHSVSWNCLGLSCSSSNYFTTRLCGLGLPSGNGLDTLPAKYSQLRSTLDTTDSMVHRGSSTTPTAHCEVHRLHGVGDEEPVCIVRVEGPAGAGPHLLEDQELHLAVPVEYCMGGQAGRWAVGEAHDG